MRLRTLVLGIVAMGVAAPIAGAEEPLFVYSCAGFRPPMEAAAAAFEGIHGVKVEMTFAGSGCLLAQAELTGKGDVFLPGEAHYLDLAAERGIVSDPTPIGYLRPVIAVERGNPRGISGLRDLGRQGMRVGLGDPRSVAVGMAAERMLTSELSHDDRASIAANVTTRAINVNELGAQLTLGGIDAAIVWDVTVPLFASLEAVVPIESVSYRTTIMGGVLKMSQNPDRARAFLAFLRSADGREILASHGYEACER